MDELKPLEFVTSELKGDLLDHFVAVALGWKIVMWGDREVWVQASGEGRFRCNVADWHPSTNPAQAWAIIESEKITIASLYASAGGLGNHPSEWHANIYEGVSAKCIQSGPTSLIAAMRAFVASKLGSKFIVTS